MSDFMVSAEQCLLNYNLEETAAIRFRNPSFGLTWTAERGPPRRFGCPRSCAPGTDNNTMGGGRRVVVVV